MIDDIPSHCSHGDSLGHSKCFHYNIVSGVCIAVKKHRGVIQPIFLYNKQWQ